MRGIFFVLMIARARVGSMVRWIVLSYPSKKCVGPKYRRYLGEMLMAYFVAGGQDSGGDGGNAWRIVGSTNGGAGGATVAFSCGGHTLNSYGGGAVQAKFTLAVNMDGGAGGTGTTGASDTSYVRIYKFG